MDTTPLGRLERVDLRAYWKSEFIDFTPWLASAENTKLLGDAIGLELEIEAKGKPVGPFAADILCRSTDTNTWVLVENQLESTDHTHLGQLLTYAAGLQATTIIWVAARFRSEHRAVLDWLNEITGDEFSFFGVEIELWRIGNSAPAPKFNVLCMPNDWTKAVQTSARMGQLTEAKQTQLAFWTLFKEYLESNSQLRCHKPQARHWMVHPIGRAGCHLSSVASMLDSAENKFGGELRVELVLNDENSKVYFGQLERHKVEIEKQVGEQLTWHNSAEGRMSRIYVRRSADIRDRNRWPEHQEWLRAHAETFWQAFVPYVQALCTPGTLSGRA